MPEKTIDDITKELAAHFPPEVVKWKAQSTTKDKKRCLAVPFIDARMVMGRLDDIFGVGGWIDSYEPAPGGMICSLSVRLKCLVPVEWVTKSDCGGMGEGDGDDAGDRLKGACSDALKRAAVKFGIGRYLYDTSKVWVDYDEQRKCIKEGCAPKAPMVKGGIVQPPAPPAIAVVPGDWLKGALKGKKAIADALSELAGVAKLGQAQLAWFPWIRDLVKAGCTAEDLAKLGVEYLGGHKLAAMAEEDVTKAYQRWCADRKGTQG